MSNNPLNNIRNVGTLRVSSGSAPAGPADEFSSSVTINDAGVLTQADNNGTEVVKVMGDGRKWAPILSATPSVLVEGEQWLQDVEGVTQQMLVASDGTARIVSGVPRIVELPQSTTVTLASWLVDEVGSVEVSVTYYNLVTGTRHGFRFWCGHDGMLSADATTTDLNSGATIVVGSLVVSTSLDLSGVGDVQEMQLNAVASAADFSATVVVERL